MSLPASMDDAFDVACAHSTHHPESSGSNSIILLATTCISSHRSNAWYTLALTANTSGKCLQYVSVRPSAGGAGHNRCESVGAYDIYRR